MDKEVCLSGKNVALKNCTEELWHEFYRGYVKDPMMDETPYIYDHEQAEKTYHLKISDSTRLYFSIIHEVKVVGLIYLKHMSKDNATTEFGIALINDSVKGKGYGTEAIILLIDYAFNTLGIKFIIADSVLRNTRSQYVLEKVGFVYTHEDAILFCESIQPQFHRKIFFRYQGIHKSKNSPVTI